MIATGEKTGTQLVLDSSCVPVSTPPQALKGRHKTAPGADVVGSPVADSRSGFALSGLGDELCPRGVAPGWFVAAPSGRNRAIPIRFP